MPKDVDDEIMKLLAAFIVRFAELRDKRRIRSKLASGGGKVLSLASFKDLENRAKRRLPRK